MKPSKSLLAILVSSAFGLAQSSVMADTAANIQTYNNNVAATYDDNGSGNFPIITAILSAPAGSVYNPGTSLDGYTNRNWSFLAQDTTGSLDMFYNSTQGGAGGYNRAVGDSVLVQGTYTRFDGIPEIGNGTPQAITVTYGTSGNSLYTPAPTVTTIPTINVGTNAFQLNASGLAGTYLQLNNVTITGAGANWAFHANVSASITDGSAQHNSMTMFLWASSYSTCAAIAAGGGPVPTGPVDMTGFVDDFGNSAEFVPISITAAVPEPSAMGLGAFGSLAALICYRLRKKA